MTTVFARIIVAATLTAVVLTSGFDAANAAAVTKYQSVAAAGDTDFSSARRHRRGRANGALLGAAAVGVIGAIAAQQQYRRSRDGAYYDGRRGYAGDPRCPNGGVYTWHQGYGQGCF